MLSQVIAVGTAEDVQTVECGFAGKDLNLELLACLCIQNLGIVVRDDARGSAQKLDGQARVFGYELETAQVGRVAVCQPDARKEGAVRDALEIACASEFIENMDGKYNAQVKQDGSNFSGGQKQRLCIARALLKNPKILILDDSTSAVDTKTDAMIRNGLANSLPNTTKIIISQRIMSISKLDKIIVMDNGRVSAVGTHHELMENSVLYKEIYMSQVKEEN